MSNIILLEDYKEFHNISNPKDDGKLAYVIDAVNNVFSEYCQTSFEPTPVVGQRAWCTNGCDIFVTAPLISVEELRKGTEVVDPSLYMINEELGLIESIKGNFSKDRYAYEVDYTFGFLDVPAALQMAAIDYVQYLLNREHTKSKSIGGQTVDYGDSALLPSHIRNILNQYRLL